MSRNAVVLAAARDAFERSGGPHTARHAVLIALARATNWPVAHVWVPTARGWVSAHEWYDDDKPRYEALRTCVEDSAPGPARGHVATALHLEVPRFAQNLGGLGDTRYHRLAVGAGLDAGVAVPIVRGGRTVAVMDFLLPPGCEVDLPLLHALGDAAELLSVSPGAPVPAADSGVLALRAG